MLIGFPKSAQLQSSRSIIFQTKRNTQIGGHTIRFMICRKQYQSSVHWGLVLFSTYHETDRMPANLSVSLCLKYNAPAWLQLSTLWETNQQLFISYAPSTRRCWALSFESPDSTNHPQIWILTLPASQNSIKNFPLPLHEGQRS